MNWLHPENAFTQKAKKEAWNTALSCTTGSRGQLHLDMANGCSR